MKKIPMLERFAAQSLVESDGELVFSKEKFSQLILTEVTDILASYRGRVVFEDGAEYDHEHPIVAIHKHFGVKE